MEKFDLSRPYRTRDGREAFATPDNSGRLVGWINSNGRFEAQLWWPGGALSADGVSRGDLVNVPEEQTVEVWIDVWRDPVSLTLDFRIDRTLGWMQASYPTYEHIARLRRPVTFTVGEGLEHGKRVS